MSGSPCMGWKGGGLKLSGKVDPEGWGQFCRKEGSWGSWAANTPSSWGGALPPGDRGLGGVTTASIFCFLYLTFPIPALLFVHCASILFRNQLRLLTAQRTHSQFSIVPIFFISSLCLMALATLPGKTIHLVLYMFHESFLSYLPDILPCSSHLQCFLTYT